MIDGASIRTAAQVAGIHSTTSFHWRHRLLQPPAQENDTELNTIMKADGTYFLESFKGQRHLSAGFITVLSPSCKVPHKNRPTEQF